jgi:hypothetical protein
MDVTSTVSVLGWNKHESLNHQFSPVPVAWYFFSLIKSQNEECPVELEKATTACGTENLVNRLETKQGDEILQNYLGEVDGFMQGLKKIICRLLFSKLLKISKRDDGSTKPWVMRVLKEVTANNYFGISKRRLNQRYM